MTLAGSLKAINFVPVQQQTNSSDCGVFAIAFATCLTFEADPKNNLSNSQNEATFSFMFEKWSIELISLFLVFFFLLIFQFQKISMILRRNVSPPPRQGIPVKLPTLFAELWM